MKGIGLLQQVLCCVTLTLVSVYLLILIAPHIH